MYQAAVHQNTLCAVPYPHEATGYKDRKDPCHRRSSTAYRRRVRLRLAKSAELLRLFSSTFCYGQRVPAQRTPFHSTMSSL